jgi:hypothetical protein
MSILSEMTIIGNRFLIIFAEPEVFDYLKIIAFEDSGINC